MTDPIKHCLLVVDDEPDVCDSVHDLLRHEFRVLKAKSAAEANRLWKDWVEQEIHVAMKAVGKVVSEECAAIEKKIAALDAKVKALEITTSEHKTEEWWQLQQLHDELSGRAEFIRESRSNA